MVDVGDDRLEDVLYRRVDGPDHVGVGLPASSECFPGYCPPNLIQDLGRSRGELIPGKQGEDIHGNRDSRKVLRKDALISAWCEKNMWGLRTRVCGKYSA